MEQTVQALGGILLKSIPTIILLIILHFYLKAMLFGPLDRVLKERRKLTEGARELAENSLAAAARKADEYEAKLREARAAVYRQQEEIRKRWLEEQAKQVMEARAHSDSAVKAAREALARDAAEARKSLQETSVAVADQIVAMVLGRRAA
ncbi:MAG: H+-transporting two-sector ATPase, subunit [Bryobacterales bacterium]|jgi:F-type H+-transporting ATPase subunit b|nr:H+-transporting two-sector ATPase, subunit [Bryobacterales bacterium]